MKAVIFGAGNIGRGFIGALMSEGGLEVVFLDVVPDVIERLNTDRAYPLHTVSSYGDDEKTVTNVRAVNSNDREAAVAELYGADIVATCVGAKAIKFIIPNLAEAVKRRYRDGKAPLDILICENLMDADKYMHSLLEPVLTPDELSHIGLVETSVGRMVPTPKPSSENVNPLLVRVEEYCVLPVDRDAFRGPVPEIKNMIPFSPFRFFIERKLYLHNMGHAISSYLGHYLGHEYIFEAIAEPYIRIAVREAMLEAALALSRKYNTELSAITEHSADLIRRFANSALGDTVERVGADIPRKLALSDRLIGAGLTVLDNGGIPAYISLGAAAALYKHLRDNALPTDRTSATKALCELSSLEAEHRLTEMIIERYLDFAEQRPLDVIISNTDRTARGDGKMIV